MEHTKPSIDEQLKALRSSLAEVKSQLGEQSRIVSSEKLLDAVPKAEERVKSAPVETICASATSLHDELIR